MNKNANKDDGQDSAQYNAMSKLLHWVTALIILGLLCLGFFMEDMPYSNFKFKLYGLHKSFGTLVIFLFACRILWRFIRSLPPHLKTHKSWERYLAKFTHFALYALLIAMPLSGWIMTSAGDFQHSFFGLFSVPHITEKNPDLFQLSRDVHKYLSFALIVLIAMHFAGALKHHLIDKDETLSRMTPRKAQRFTIKAIVAIAFLTLGYSTYAVGKSFFAKEETEVQGLKDNSSNIKKKVTEQSASTTKEMTWNITADKSDVSFQVIVQNDNFSGTLGAPQGIIVFDPDNLENSHVEILVPTTNIQTGSPDRNQYIAMPPWLHSESFPESKLLSKNIEKISDNNYIAHGTLTIRDVSLPISYPFTFEKTQNESDEVQANVTGHFSINRLDYGIGTGDWSDTKSVENAVQVTVSITATLKEQ